MTITGTGFTGATAVDFGTTAATNVDVDSAHADHGHQPGGHGHGGRDGGRRRAARRPPPRPTSSRYVAAPTVTGISPTSGPSAGGTSVTITGTGFTGATAVDFGTTAATNFDVDSAHADHGHQPGGHGHGGRDGDRPGRHVGHLLGRPVHLRGGADGDGRQSALVRRRRHDGDDHGTGFTGATAVDFGTAPATNVTVVIGTRRSRPPARRARARWT